MVLSKRQKNYQQAKASWHYQKKKRNMLERVGMLRLQCSDNRYRFSDVLTIEQIFEIFDIRAGEQEAVKNWLIQLGKESSEEYAQAVKNNGWTCYMAIKTVRVLFSKATQFKPKKDSTVHNPHNNYLPVAA